MKKDKTEKVKSLLIEEKILKDKIEFWNMEAFTSGENIDLFIQGYSNVAKHRDIAVVVKTESSILQYDEETGEEIDIVRKNMVEIVNAEGGFGSWSYFCELLQVITGDKYKGAWEVF